VGRKLAVYLNRRKRVRQEGERREIFLRYLGEVAHAVAAIKEYGDRPRKDLYGRLVDVAKRKTAVADTQLNGEKKQREIASEEFGENVLSSTEETPENAIVERTANLWLRKRNRLQTRTSLDERQENSRFDSRPCRYCRPVRERGRAMWTSRHDRYRTFGSTNEAHY
jgi:hypothetical protein